MQDRRRRQPQDRRKGAKGVKGGKKYQVYIE
jgi:hypothetical protein